MHEILGGGGLAATVDVEHGARIVSLVSDRREWLSSSFPRPVGSAREFVHEGTGGWDDAIPTVEACVLPGGEALADHGEVWDRSWQATLVTASRLDVAITLESLPLRLERRMAATSAGLRFEWTVSTRALRRVSFLWSAHPLFAAPPGTTVVLDDGTIPALVEEYPRRGAAVPMPRSIDALAEGAALKAFCFGSSSASVIRPDGRGLRLSWDAGKLPVLGLYFDRGEFTSRPVVAVEPTMAASDSAARAGRLWSVARGHPVSWAIDISPRE